MPLDFRQHLLLILTDVLFESCLFNLVRESNNIPNVNVIQPAAASEFVAFSSRSRNLGRMTSEQALDFYLDQHRSRPSQ